MIYLDKVLIQVLPVIGFLYIYLYTMARRDKKKKKIQETASLANELQLRMS